jgi:hypothetical protein
MVVDRSIEALADITTALFPEHLLRPHPDLQSKILRVLEGFLKRWMSFEAARRAVDSLIGITRPLEQLNAILGADSQPIPSPDGPRPASGRRKARSWTLHEDQRLLCGIYKLGIKNWTAISEFVGSGRSRSQCSQRWYRGLDPTISKLPWSLGEEQRLVGLVRQLGDRSWTRIASQMGNRSDVQCSYKYKQLQKEMRSDARPVRPLAEPNPPRRVRLLSVATLIGTREWQG